MGEHPKVLVTGAGGQVGLALRRLLSEADFRTHSDLDVTDRRATEEALKDIEVAIHLAAFTDVDGCDEDPLHARLVNSEGTENVARAASKARARLLYVSTDYVFDGSKEGDNLEEDAPNPLNEYGRSKLEGERFVLDNPHGLVVRSSWVFGEGRNFIRTILEVAQRMDRLKVVDDQRGRPTSAHDLAAALHHLATANHDGIVHVCGTGPPCSWAELADFVLRLRRNDASVVPVDTPTYAEQVGRVLAPRPKNSSLSTRKAALLSVPLCDWRQAVRSYVMSLP